MSKSGARRKKLSSAQRRAGYAIRRGIPVAIVLAVMAAIFIADRAGVFGVAPQGDMEKYHDREFRVARTIDGDTIDLDVPDVNHRTTRVRFWGVDTPETLKRNTPIQHFGPEASAFTKKVTLGKTVRVLLDPARTRDRYGRLLAYIILPDGRMLNRVLVAEGYGYSDPRFEHRFLREFRNLQKKAKSSRAGLWKRVRKEDLPYYYSNLRLATR